MTQGDLAKTLGVSSQAVTNWLKGPDFPRPATLLKLAATLKLSFEQMVDRDTSAQPVVAFRKKGNAKTTLAHISNAREIGELLKPLVPYLAEQQVLRTQITSPSTEYHKLQLAVAQTRERLGIGEQAVLGYKDLIGEFKNCGAILIPVMWGTKGNHENALHIRLPKEDITFIFLNLDTHIEDFKFWMAHELAHVYTPELASSDKGEDFADAFAGALLFPKACAEVAYHDAFKQGYEEEIIATFQEHAHEHEISLNTVFQQVKHYARNNDLPSVPVDEKSIHATRNSNAGPLISETLFDPMPPSPTLYMSDAGNVFQSDFFHALKRMFHARETGPAYLQQILNASIHDARALHEELRR
jgi:transcriptional regulator with XRE-family HTH domain